MAVERRARKVLIIREKAKASLPQGIERCTQEKVNKNAVLRRNFGHLLGRVLGGEDEYMSVAVPAGISREIEQFLSDSPSAVAIEGGEMLFDFSSAKYSVRDEGGKCVLHLWSEERNAVRRVVDAEVNGAILRLSVLRFGQAKPSIMEICRESDRRTPSAKKRARAVYQRLLGRMLQRNFPGHTLLRMTSNADLERSFGPTCARGLLKQGNCGFAVVGVNGDEPQGVVDTSLTLGVLWLDYLREQMAPRMHVKGLKLFVPWGRAATIRARMAHLNRDMAQFELYQVSEREEVHDPIDISDSGNMDTRLVRCPAETAVRERFAHSIARVSGLVPRASVIVRSNSEVAFRLFGLEFARAHMAPLAGSFKLGEQIVFGVGAAEAPLDENTEQIFAEFVKRMCEVRHPHGDRAEALYRLHPERWLEAMVQRDVSVLDDRLDPSCVYSQVPAFSASDRAMIDLLARTREGRLAVIELKADEDMHLPLQGLDYWARVRWHQRRDEFRQYGYFGGHELSSLSPLLIMVAPALRVHPTTSTVLRYLSPEIDWLFVGVDERWRDGVRRVFRKRSGDSR